MMNKDNQNMENSESTPDNENATDADHDVTEEYIMSVMHSLKDAIPEDFEQIETSIPTDAEDGERVAMVVTGYAEGGKLTNPVGMRVSVNEPEKPGKINKMLSEESGKNTEE